MREVLRFSHGSFFDKVPFSCVSVLLAAAFFLFSAATGVRECECASVGARVEGLTSVIPDASSFAASSFVKFHTTTVSSLPGTFFAKGVLVVQLVEGLRPEVDRDGGFRTTDAALDELLRQRGLVRAERLFPWDCEKNPGGACNFVRLIFPEETDLESLMGELGRTRGVARAEPVGVHPVDYYPDDFFFGIQWGLNQVRDHDVNAPEAWDVEKGDPSIVVAIVDTGVDWSHPDLGGTPPYTGGNIWTNWTEFYGTPGVDDDGNGFVDDVRGWDFVTGVSGAYAGEDADSVDNDPSDFFGHGTHVAGIAAALTGNTIGVAGLANGCRIMPVRAGWCAYDPYGRPAGVVRMDFCASAILYAAKNGARVINCSWANDNSGGLDTAVDTAMALGAIVVVSAGNDASSSQGSNYLSTRGDCFSVAATNSRDEKPYYSNYGGWISFCAPGDTIASTYFKSSTREHAYAYYSGTSMAAPFVSALSALLLSKNPSLTRSGVQGIIASTCDPIDALNPTFSGKLGAGRINAYAALSLGSGDWQARTQGDVVGSPLPIRGGLRSYVAVTSSEGCFHLIDSDGDVTSGWTKCGLGSPTSPAAGDVDADGGPELVVGTSTGNVHVWNVSGSAVPGWPRSLGAGVVSGPMLCDLDADDSLEVVCACADSTIHVLSGDGSPEPGWPVKLTGYVTGEPCLGFIGADTGAVILVPTSDSKLYALGPDGNSVTGWPVTVGSGRPGSPVAIDMDDDGRSEVLLGDSEGRVHAIDDTGLPIAGWPQTASAAITGSLALGDVDGDNIPDVVGGTSDGWVYAWNLNGQVLPGWPVKTAGTVASSPSLVDLDQQGGCEVVVGSDDRDVHIWTGTGAPFSGWPRSTGGAVRSSPCVWDFDGNGLLELAVGSNDTKLHFWKLGGSQFVDSLMTWPMYRHDAQRTGNSGSRSALPVGAEKRSLAVNTFPNPFVGTVTFECTIRGDGIGSGERGRISLYDVTGREVASVSVRGEGRTLNVSWDGGNETSQKLASGVYFYRAEVDGLKTRGKLVFFKH